MFAFRAHVKAFLVKMVEHVVRCMTRIHTRVSLLRETMEDTVRMVKKWDRVHENKTHFKIVYKLTRAPKTSLRRVLGKGTQRAN